MAKKRLKLLSLLPVLLLGSCYDMQYEDIEEYYDYFDDTAYLKYVDDDGVSFNGTTASLEDNFLNKNTQDNFDEDCLVDEEYYSYFAVCLEEEDTIFRELCLFIRPSVDVNMEIRYFIVDKLPTKGRGFNAPPKDSTHIYDDEFINPIATISYSFSANVFRDVFVDNWVIDGKETKFITLKEDEYLLVQFYNNTGYGKDEGLKSVKFTMTNFIFNKK